MCQLKLYVSVEKVARYKMNKKTIIVLLVLVLAWYLNEPVPIGFSSPWSLRAATATGRLFTTALWISDVLGIYPLEQSIRAIKTPPEISIPDHLLVGDDIFDGVPVRTYKPVAKPKDAKGYPALVFYHGGGWATDSTRSLDQQMIGISNELDIVIISVEYRLAPEFKFPIPFEDCVTATKYFLSNARTYGVNPERIAIGGESAGGNLAAAVALKLRDDKFSPTPKAQILVYPALQAMDLSLPSYSQNRHGPFLNRYLMGWFLSLYATGSKEYASAIMNNDHTSSSAKKLIYNKYLRHEDLPMDYHYKPYKKPSLDFGNSDIWNKLKNVLENPYFAPLMADDVAGVADAFVFTAHYDVLRDDGLLYVKKLRDAGVSVTHSHGTKAYHGVFKKNGTFVEGKECMNSIVDYIKSNV